MLNSVFKDFSGMLRVSKIVSLESWLHFWFELKTKRGLPPSTYTTREFKFEQPSSVLWKSDYLQRKLIAFSCQLLLQRVVLRCWQGALFGKINFCLTKNPSNSIQTVSTVIVKSYLLYQHPASYLSKIELFATVIKSFQL